MPILTSKDVHNLAQTQIHGENIILIFEVKSQGDGMNVRDTSSHMVRLCLRTKNCARTQSCVIYVYLNLTLRSKIYDILRSWMYATHPFIVIDLCAKYGMPLSKQTKLRVGHKTCQKPINLTLRSKANVVLGSWIKATHHLMVIHKYGEPMSKQKKVMGRIMNVRNTSSHGDTPMCQIW